MVPVHGLSVCVPCTKKKKCILLLLNGMFCECLSDPVD